MRVFICFLAFLFFQSCASMPYSDSASDEVFPDTAQESPAVQSESVPVFPQTDGPDALLASTLPGEGVFELAGLSPGFYDPEEELEAALAHAAEQLAIYYGAVVVSQEFLSEQTGSTYAARRIEIRYDEELAERLKDSCITGPGLRGKDYFVSLVSYASADAQELPYEIRPADENDRPVWIDTPPRIDGYIAVVGSSAARKGLAESWGQSDREGMARIAEILGAQIRSQEALLTKEGGAALKSESYVISSKRIKGMFVIARWRSPDRRTYYSLVVKKKDS